MFSGQPPANAYSSWACEKPMNYRSPSDSVELVHAKLGQFNAVVNRLALHTSTQFVVDHSGLTRLLTEHLKQNPAATDPFNIKFRINPASGEIELRHFDLECRISQAVQGQLEGRGSAAGTHLQADRFRQALIIYLDQNFNSVAEKTDVLQACDIALRHDSGFARFNLATRLANVDLLPPPETLHNSLRLIGGNSPEVERYVARRSLARLIDCMLGPENTQIALGQAIEPQFLNKIVQTGLVFLRVLNTADQANPICTNTGLNMDQLRQLLMVLGAGFNFVQNDHQQANQIVQFVTHLHNKLVSLEVLQLNSDIFEHMPPDIRADLDVVMAAVQRNGSLLEFALPEHRNNREVVLNAVQQYGLSLDFASEELRNDREMVMHAISQDAMALESAGMHLRGDRDLMMTAVRQNGLALELASMELRSDRDLVLTAVRQNGMALEYANDELRNDREVVMIAVQSDDCMEETFGELTFALEFASADLRNDREVVLAAVKKEGWALRDASIRLRGDREVVMEALKQCAHALDFASDELRNDPALVNRALFY